MKVLILCISIFFKVISLSKAAQTMPFIYGGYPAEEGQFPYVVSLQKFDDVGHFCGGAILNSRWIITAGHCIHPNIRETVIAVVGTLHLPYGVKYRIIDAIKYQNPVYITKLPPHDIGLIKVKGDIEFNENIKPIKICDQYIEPNFTVIASGWGKTEWGSPNFLLYTILTTVSNRDCARMYAPFAGYLVILPNHICTDANGLGTCSGDSGGPLEYKGQLVGITSFGNTCAGGIPDGFERVLFYKKWIDSIINDSK